MKDYIKKVLVAPGDVEFILLKKRHQNFIPSETNCCHVILEGQNRNRIINIISNLKAWAQTMQIQCVKRIHILNQET